MRLNCIEKKPTTKNEPSDSTCHAKNSVARTFDISQAFTLWECECQMFNGLRVQGLKLRVVVAPMPVWMNTKKRLAIRTLKLAVIRSRGRVSVCI